MRTGKTVIRLTGCAGLSESPLLAHAVPGIIIDYTAIVKIKESII